MNFPKFPSFRYGPNGQSGIFNSEAEVPAGWQDHPSKVEGAEAPADPGSVTNQGPLFTNPGDNRQIPEAFNPGGAPLGTTTDQGSTTLTGATTPGEGSAQAQADAQARAPGGEDNSAVDANGHQWNGDDYLSPPDKTNAGLWKLKPGRSRPDPLPGFPKPPLDL